MRVLRPIYSFRSGLLLPPAMQWPASGRLLLPSGPAGLPHPATFRRCALPPRAPPVERRATPRPGSVRKR